MGSVSACSELPITELLQNNQELVVYDVPIDSSYSLLFQEGYNAFDVPIYSNLPLDCSDISVQDVEADENVSVTVSNFRYADISVVDSKTVDYVENVVTLKVLPTENEIVAKAQINRITFSVKGRSYSLSVNVFVYRQAVSNVYPDPVFERDFGYDVFDDQAEYTALMFLGNLSSDYVLYQYSMLGGDWLSVLKSEWIGRNNTLIYEIEGEMTEQKELNRNEFYFLATYFTFSYCANTSPWYGDYLLLQLSKRDENDNGDRYTLAYKIDNHVDLSSYYDDVYHAIFDRK